MKLSIITINYNNLEGLRKTIESVVNQTWQEFEWIIVDGGSTDGSRELIEETAAHLAAQDWRTEQFSLLGFTAEGWESGGYPVPSSREAHSRTLLWASEKDKGIYNAMNKGIVMAQGEYCLFLNSGDWLYDNDVLQNVSSYDHRALFVVGGIESSEGSRVCLKNEDVTGRFFMNNSLPHQSTFIRLEVFKIYGLYDETYRIISDWELFLKSVLVDNVEVEFLPDIISVFDVNGISETQTKKNFFERQQVKEKYIPRLIQEDYVWVTSLWEIRQRKVGRFLYSMLYRIAKMLP